MAEQNMCISIYTSLGQVVGAVETLQSGGFEGHALSLLGRDRWEGPHPIGHCITGDALVCAGAQPDAWQRIWLAIPGRGALWLFADGPLLMAGRLVEAVAEAPDGQELAATLVTIGVPESSAGLYADELTNGRLLLFVHGSLEATDRAQRLLSTSPATNHTLHHGASE